MDLDGHEFPSPLPQNDSCTYVHTAMYIRDAPITNYLRIVNVFLFIIRFSRVTHAVSIVAIGIEFHHQRALLGMCTVNRCTCIYMQAAFLWAVYPVGSILAYIPYGVWFMI